MAYQPAMVMGWAMLKRTVLAMLSKRNTLATMATTSCMALMTRSLASIRQDHRSKRRAREAQYQ